MKKLIISTFVLTGVIAVNSVIAGVISAEGDDFSFSIQVPNVNMQASFNPEPFNHFQWQKIFPGVPFPANMVEGGFERNHPLFVCKAKYKGGVHPGKLVGDTCNISWGGKEVLMFNYKVLISNYPLGWVKASGGDIPRGAVVGGFENGHPLYICKAKYFGGVHTGKIVGETCNFGYGGKEIMQPDYKVLVS